MSKSLELSDSVFEALEEAASASGTTPEGWIAANLPTGTAPDVAQSQRTLADEFAGYIGLFSSGRGDLSERVGELFAEGMIEKHRARQP